MLHTILHRTDLIVFPLTLQTITTSQGTIAWYVTPETAAAGVRYLLKVVGQVKAAPDGADVGIRALHADLITDAFTRPPPAEVLE